MRYVLIALTLSLVGCATAPKLKEDTPKTVQTPTPCGADNCGKKAEWQAAE